MNEPKPPDQTMQVPLLSDPDDAPRVEAPIRRHVSFSEQPTAPAVVQRGQVQIPAYRDAWCAVLFYVQVLVVLFLAISLGPLIWDEAAGHSSSSSNSNSTSSNTTTTTTTTTTVQGSNNTTDDDSSWAPGPLLLLLLPVLLVAVAAAMVAVLLFFAVLVRYTERLVQLSFWVTPALFTVLAVMATIERVVTTSSSSTNTNNDVIYLWCVAATWTVVAVCHYVWNRRSIPYTTANLQVAVRALLASPYHDDTTTTDSDGLPATTTTIQPGSRMAALLGVSCAAQVVLCAWWCLAVVALGGVVAFYNQIKVPCDDNNNNSSSGNNDQCSKSPPVWIFVLWGLSGFWTQSVIQNVLRTTTAGAVGSWWFAPGNSHHHREDDAASSPLEEQADETRALPPHGVSFCSRGCCIRGCGCCCYSSDVSDALYRSLTFSFGSICLGSLLVAVIQVLDQMVRAAQYRYRREHNNNSDSIFLCLVECLLHLLGRLVDYFNAWAFCYVGLYGYDYLTAGVQVTQLLRNRGFSSMITDRLLFRVLAYGKWAIGAVAGGLAVMVLQVVVLVSSTSSYTNDDDDNDSWLRGVFFLLGMAVGIFLADVAFRIVESAVRTILVCFAESPADAAAWHPAEFECLRAGWVQSYPEEWPSAAAAAADIPESTAFLLA